MRRLVLLLLMVVLPLQWSWAAAASVCEHESTLQSTHFGHHEHEHHGAVQAADDVDAETASLGSHPDCGVCNALGTLFPPSVDGASTQWCDVAAVGACESAISDHIVDTPLRPPMTTVS